MISPIHPSLEGIAAERFFALGQELARRQRSKQQLDGLVGLMERETAWAEHAPGLNGNKAQYIACARVLIDLAKARWSVAEDRFGIELRSPDPSLHKHLSPAQVQNSKNLVRDELQPLLNQQFASPSVRKFIAQMEQPTKTSRTKSIQLLIADGREVGRRLELARSLPIGSERNSALQTAIRPYLQLVVPDERDKFTNLPLGDVWRYFRYSWCIPQLPIPGRQLLYLVRDGAHPYHAVMGIAGLNNCAMQNKVRDDLIGWTSDAFIARARAAAKAKGSGAIKELTAMLNYLHAQLDAAISHIEIKGLCSKQQLENPTPQLIDSLRRQSGEFADSRRGALEFISKGRDVPDLVQDYESVVSGVPPVSDEVLRLEDKPLKDRAMTHARRMLVAKKRAAELARLLDAKLTLWENAEALRNPRTFVGGPLSEEVMSAIHNVLLSVKSERVGTNMLELTTCGAVPPYNPLLAGKLVALLMLSPQVAHDYHRRYGQEASIISSQLKNERREKDSTLVYLGTTSLFAEGSSQYERLKLPAGTISPDQAELRYENLGNTTGYGTVQFSPDTVRAVEQVFEDRYGFQDVNSIFGEGFSPRMRKLKAGLQMLGFDSEHLLIHHQQRRVFGVQIFSGAPEFLMGKKTSIPDYVKTPQKYLGATERIAEYWRTRWLAMRLDHEPSLAKLEFSSGWKLSGAINVGESGQSQQSSKPPAPPPQNPVSADVRREVAFWRSLAAGGPEVCSDVLGPEDLEVLHVPQDLDRFLLDRVRKGFSIVLTGNAGDGKTHLLRRLEPELQRLKAVVQYDASAAMDHTKILPILNEWRKAQRANRPYCLAANEYPLYLLREHGSKKPNDLPVLTEVDRQCRLRLSYGEPGSEERAKTSQGKVLVVDLSLRNPLHADFVGAMLDRLLKNDALVAYAKSNTDLNFAESFRRLSNETVRQRLIGLFDRLRALGHRATVREVWIVLARLLFGTEQKSTPQVVGRYADWYSERLFDSGNHLSLVEHLRKAADPAQVSHPAWDLRLEAANGTRAEDWLVDHAEPTLDRRRMGQRETEGRALFAAIKRRFYFEHRAGEEAFALEGGYANEFRDLLQQSEAHRTQVGEQIVAAINRCYCPTATPERSKLYLWVGHRYHEQPSRAFVAQSFFHTTDFEVLLPRLPKRVEGAFRYSPDHFILRLRGRGERYRLIIDFQLYRTLRKIQRGLPRHLLPERDLNRLDSFLTQLHGATPQRANEFIVYNQDTLSTSRIQVSEDHSKYLRVVVTT